MKTHKLLSLILAAVMLMAVCPLHTFANDNKWSDVPVDAWYNDEINKVSDWRLMNGVSSSLSLPSQFAPDMTLTREQFITILARLDNNIYSYSETSDEEFTSKYSDYSSDKWYGKYIEWAEKQNITQGIGNNLFGVGSDITREEMATLIYRYLENREFTFDNYSDTVEKYHDEESVSEWAVDAVKFMHITGLMEGDDNSNFMPTKSATRAEAATIFARLYETLVVDFNVIFTSNLIEKVIYIPTGTDGDVFGDEIIITDSDVIEATLSLLRNAPITNEHFSLGKIGTTVLKLYFKNDSNRYIRVDIDDAAIRINNYKEYTLEQNYLDALSDIFTPAE